MALAMHDSICSAWPPTIACEMEHGIKVTMLQIWEILRCAPTVRLCCFPTRQQVSAARQAK